MLQNLQSEYKTQSVPTPFPIQYESEVSGKIRALLENYFAINDDFKLSVERRIQDYVDEINIDREELGIEGITVDSINRSTRNLLEEEVRSDLTDQLLSRELESGSLEKMYESLFEMIESEESTLISDYLTFHGVMKDSIDAYNWWLGHD